MQPSELDTRRAALCCLAINQNRPEDVQRLFDRYRDLNFGKVVVPPFREKSGEDSPEKLLIATAVDVSDQDKHVVFVAFKGNSGLADILHGCHKGELSVLDKNQAEQGRRNQASGFFHEVFYDRLLSAVPSVDRILQFAEHLTTKLSSSGSGSGSSHGRRSIVLPSALRVVFCGHGTGGAISHMAMLTYLLSLSSMSSGVPQHSPIISDIFEDTDNLKSISFGAPLFCDESTINNFNSTIGISLGKHLFNFFSKTDPVPFLLFGLPSQEGEGKNYKTVRDKFSKVLKEVGSLLDSPEAADLHNDSYVRASLIRLRKSSLQQLANLHSELSSIDGSNPYGLFGSYVDVSATRTTTRPSDIERFARQRISSFSQVPNFEAHTMTSYFKALQLSAVNRSSVSTATITVGSPPEVRSASMVILHGEERTLNMARIEVTGRNLSLLLEKNCSISTLHADRWSVIAGDDKTICWETTSALTDGELRELEKSGRASPATKIKVETTFGCTKDFTEVQMRNTTAGSFAVEGLKHALGKMVILANTVGPVSLRQSVTSIRVGVETVARIAGIPERWVFNLERILKDERYTVKRKKELLDEGIYRKICEELCEKPLLVEFDVSEQSGRMHTTDYLLGILQMVLSVINPIAGIAGIFIMLGVKGLLLLVHYMLRSNPVELRTYEEIIKFLYAQIFLQLTKGEEEEDQETLSSSEGNHALASNLGAVSIRSCEKAIYWYAERVGYDNITFRSELKYKTEVEKRMKARTRLVHAIQETYHKAKRTKVLAVVGTENAGKSTLINLLKRHNSTSSSGEDVSDAHTGFRSHTSDVQGYDIGTNYTAVDFPGVGGADAIRSETWNAFEHVPDLCIVMAKFSGDVDSTSQELCSTVAEKLCKRYILLVNQVDSIMKGKPGAKAWKEYSPDVVESLRNKYRLAIGASNEEGTVYMCCLNDEDLYDYDREQLKDRGILFGGDVADRILNLLDADRTEETF